VLGVETESRELDAGVDETEPQPEPVEPEELEEFPAFAAEVEEVGDVF
jgi:hypothetical protein